jgi:hypothetical protein
MAMEMLFAVQRCSMTSVTIKETYINCSYDKNRQQVEASPSPHESIMADLGIRNPTTTLRRKNNYRIIQASNETTMIYGGNWDGKYRYCP